MTTNEPAAPKIDTTEVRKASFWISQLCIILATIIGVYLAANQGFKQALAYGNIQIDRNNYHLRESLRDEITRNIANTRDYLKVIAKGGVANRRAPLQLDTYVWDAMKFSPSTLEVPAELLNANMNFMRTMNDLQAKIASGDTPVETATKRIEELLATLETDTIPKFDANIKAIKTRLDKQGVEP